LWLSDRLVVFGFCNSEKNGFAEEISADLIRGYGISVA